MGRASRFCIMIFLLLGSFPVRLSYDGPFYDSTAYTDCKRQPEEPLYNGGILKNHPIIVKKSNGVNSTSDKEVYFPTFILKNLTQGNIYCFSIWLKIKGAPSALIKASLETETATYECIGTTIAKRECWSFLKGGFLLDSPSNLSILSFQNPDGRDIDIAIASQSLQPFTRQQWKMNQQYTISNERQRAVTVHVSDKNGGRVQGASVSVEQISEDFPFGSAIASTILGNLPYQEWFLKRFNAAVFENELKWDSTEPVQGKVNYTIPDKLLEFVRANQITTRGHTIFWENPKFTPTWIFNLTGPQLESAVNSRIYSLMSKYQGEFVHWDVNNEMLHYDFYEQRLGINATLRFFETAHQSDPLANLFMNEFNVIETCNDADSSVDSYIASITKLKHGGATMNGIGLQGHFTIPNPPLIRAVIDKLATLGLPIWLTEVDIHRTIDKEAQAIYLDDVLREVFSHPSVNGIILWTALHPRYGCYMMCLTDNDFQNLPTGDVVDKLLDEWKTGRVENVTDGYGSFSFYGFLGEYKIVAEFGNRSANSTFSLSKGKETRHIDIQL